MAEMQQVFHSNFPITSQFDFPLILHKSARTNLSLWICLQPLK